MQRASLAMLARHSVTGRHQSSEMDSSSDVVACCRALERGAIFCWISPARKEYKKLTATPSIAKRLNLEILISPDPVNLAFSESCRTPLRSPQDTATSYMAAPRLNT